MTLFNKFVDFCIGGTMGALGGCAFCMGSYYFLKTCDYLGIINYTKEKWLTSIILLPVTFLSVYASYIFVGRVKYNYLYRRKFQPIKNIIKKQMNDALLLHLPPNYIYDENFDYNYYQRVEEYERIYNQLFPAYQDLRLLDLTPRYYYRVNDHIMQVTQNILDNYVRELISYHNEEMLNKSKYVENIISTIKQLSNTKIICVVDFSYYITKMYHVPYIFLLEYFKKTCSFLSHESKCELFRIVLGKHFFEDISELIIVFFGKQANINELTYLNPLVILKQCIMSKAKLGMINETIGIYIKLLVNLGNDINLQNKYLGTINDINYGFNKQFIKLCLANGFDLEIKNRENVTILTRLILRYTRDGQIKQNKWARIKYLIDNGAKIDNYLEIMPCPELIDPRVEEYYNQITTSQVWKKKLLLALSF